MDFFHHISTVARYEAKTLRRSWFFRLFSLGALVILTIMNIAIFSPIGDEDWELVANPSSLPLINLYLLNIGQAIVVIFLAADFLKRDKKVDTNEVLYTRPMSNFEYITGKTIGILRLFLGLDLIILTIGLIINIISKSMTVDISAYFEYLLIIVVPTIIFSLGLAFMLMSVIRNQAITFLLLLGIAALDMFWLWFRAGSMFDYMAFGLPVLKSDVTGFGNTSLILSQRGLFLFAGLALVFMTILIFKRLPQSKLQTTLAGILMIISLGGGALCGIKTYELYKRDIIEKEAVIATSSKYENSIFPRLSAAAIEIDHNGNMISVKAQLSIWNENDKPIEKYLFSLNPDLIVTSVTSGNTEMKFVRTNHIIEIDPGKALLKGQTDSVTIHYSGTIDESFCYPDNDDKPNASPYRIAMVNVFKRQAFLSEDYVLLTPETYWYPTPSLNYYPSIPARIKIDFTNYSLKVKTKKGLTAVSQGEMEVNDGVFSFSPDSPLTGLTLAIGNYQSDTLKVDSVSYIGFHFPGHDYYKKDLSELRDTLPTLVSGIMRELETNFSTKYPFSTLKLVEVPIHFYSYPRMNTQTRAELQPSMILLPEKMSTIQNAGFGKQFQRQKKRQARSNQVITDKELQVRIFNNFIRNTFISGENFRYVNGVVLNEPTRYRLGPSFYFFKNSFSSTEYPVINSVFEAHLQKVTPPQGSAIQMQGNLSDNDRANLILRKYSFRDMLALNPSTDTIRAIVTVKGDYLFNLIRARAGIEEFKTWFLNYIDENKFKSVDIKKLNEDIKARFGFEFYPYLEDWFNKKEQPGFIFTNVQVNEIVVGDRTRFLTSFIVSNPEPVAGIFNIAVRTGNQGGMPGTMVTGGPGNVVISASQGRGMEAADISKIVLVGAMEAKKISIVLDAQPRTLQINSLFSKNLPGEIIIPVDEITRSKNINLALNSEETLQEMPEFANPGEIIVDNEDPGFDNGNITDMSPLKRLLGIKNRQGENYESINLFWAPEYWQPVVESVYYGKYIRSAVSTRGSDGERSVKWSAKITEPGYYDIYCYIGKTGNRMTVRQGGPAGVPPPPGAEGRNQGNNPFRDMHYKVYHDEGVEEITVDFENADPEWFPLGRYYLSKDTAKVELTNKSTGRIVLGDAIRWVRSE